MVSLLGPLFDQPLYAVSSTAVFCEVPAGCILGISRCNDGDKKKENHRSEGQVPDDMGFPFPSDNGF